MTFQMLSSPTWLEAILGDAELDSKCLEHNSEVFFPIFGLGWQPEL